VGGGAVARRPAGAGVHEDGVEAGGAGAEDVDGVEIADVGGLLGSQVGAVERDLKDARVGLLDADLGRIDDEDALCDRELVLHPFRFPGRVRTARVLAMSMDSGARATRCGG